jgi:hypothetical protein
MGRNEAESKRSSTMSTTEIGFNTGSKEAREAAARAEASAAIHLRRDRSSLYGGLCSNCERLETCTYPSTTSETWFCGEYSVAKAPEQKLQVVDLHVDEVPEAKLGLCVNCEARGRCTLPKPIGGVWFCNEYE